MALAGWKPYLRNYARCMSFFGYVMPGMGKPRIGNLIASKLGISHPADSFATTLSSGFSPIVLGGCARSGTTLLRIILDSHRRICCGPESSVFLTRNLAPSALARRFGFGRGEVRAIYDAVRSRPEFIQAFAGLCMRKAGKARWAEKTPRNIRNIGEIFRCFPAARFLHVLRDGRDVACSLRTLPRHKVVDGKLVPLNTWNPIDDAARRWRDDIERSRSWWSDPRFHTVRYEELVLHPRRVLEKLMAFLGENWDEAMLAHAVAESPFRDPTRFPQNPEAIDPLRASALGRWQRELGARDRRILKRIAGSLLIELGYATDDAW
jgi:protein-tyrosine sulfotransferase